MEFNANNDIYIMVKAARKSYDSVKEA